MKKIINLALIWTGLTVFTLEQILMSLAPACAAPTPAPSLTTTTIQKSKQTAAQKKAARAEAQKDKVVPESLDYYRVNIDPLTYCLKNNSDYSKRFGDWLVRIGLPKETINDFLSGWTDLGDGWKEPAKGLGVYGLDAKKLSIGKNDFYHLAIHYINGRTKVVLDELFTGRQVIGEVRQGFTGDSVTPVAKGKLINAGTFQELTDLLTEMSGWYQNNKPKAAAPEKPAVSAVQEQMPGMKFLVVPEDDKNKTIYSVTGQCVLPPGNYKLVAIRPYPSTGDPAGLEARVSVSTSQLPIYENPLFNAEVKPMIVDGTQFSDAARNLLGLEREGKYLVYETGILPFDNAKTSGQVRRPYRIPVPVLNWLPLGEAAASVGIRLTDLRPETVKVTQNYIFTVGNEQFTISIAPMPYREAQIIPVNVSPFIKPSITEVRSIDYIPVPVGGSGGGGGNPIR